MAARHLEITRCIIFLPSEFNNRFTIYPKTTVVLSRKDKGTLIKWTTKKNRRVHKKIDSPIDIVCDFIKKHR